MMAALAVHLLRQEAKAAEMNVCRDPQPFSEEQLRDPSSFWDNRLNKRSPKSPDFRLKQTGETVWISAPQDPHSIFCEKAAQDLPRRHFPDRNTLLNLIKSSGKSKNLLRTRKIHSEILKQSLIFKDAYIATTLVTAYAKCGALEQAEEVFEQIPIKDVVSWNALITGYAQQGLAIKAATCLKRMKMSGIQPDSVTYICILKACGTVGSLEIGEEVDAEVRNQGLLQKDIVLGNTLVAMYAKCGALVKAREVFEQLQIQNVVSWNALIAGYVQYGLAHDALKCFQQMQDDGVCPDSVTYICILKCCGIIRSLDIGKDIDTKVRKLGLLQSDIIVGNALVDMYCKCGALERAREVFQQLPLRDAVTWSTLIAGYVQHELGEEALYYFLKMQAERVRPNVVTYVCTLKACGIVKSLEIGAGIHADVKKQGLLKTDVSVGNALVDMYSRCGELKKAVKVFEQLPLRDVVSWNALITGYAHHGLGYEALKCFRQMEDEGVRPDIITYVCVVKACAIVGSLEIADKIETDIRKLGMVQKDIVLGNALVDMYFKCGAPQKAYKVFMQLPVRDVVSWNALIAGYTQHGLGEEALELFSQMRIEGMFPDAVTYICILKTCGLLGYLELGKEIDDELRKRGLLQKDIVLGTALVDMYSKCRDLQKAREVFEHLPEHNVVAWNALISGYAQQGLNDDVFHFFRQMEAKGVPPDAVTYGCILKTCSILGALQLGESIVKQISKRGLLQNDVVLGNTLLDMYSKCGALKKALEVFEQLPVRDVVCWNVLIGGYAQLGNANAVFYLYTMMKLANIAPNSVTFILLLTACSHAGLLNEGENLFFNEMHIVNNLDPVVEHYTCMIDLFGRAGHIEKAKALLENISHCGHIVPFLTMLAACRKWRNVSFGRWAFEHSVGLDATCSAAYFCMEQIYATAGLQAEAERIEALRTKNKATTLRKHCSWTDGLGNMHSFLVSDKSHPQSRRIQAKLEDIHRKLLQEGYLQHWDQVLISDDKRENLCSHSATMSIACAVINTHQGMPVHVTKNVRLCESCHTASLLVSLVEKRRIVVRDASRIHIFEGGRCMCNDHDFNLQTVAGRLSKA